MKLLLKTILTIQFFSYFFIFAQLQVVQAANVEFKPQVGIGEYQKDQSYPVEKSTAMIAKYIRAIYKYAIGIVGILATVVMMLGGIMWLTAGGNQTRIGEAKSWITASISGLVIALCSYLILATVNPALVNLNVSTVEKVSEPKDKDANIDTAGCCGIYGESGSISMSPGGGYTKCVYLDDIKKCPSGNVFKGKTCNEIEDCPQHGTLCNGRNDGLVCGEYKICYKSECKDCKKKEGAECGNDPCCTQLGLVCKKNYWLGIDDAQPDKCIKK